MSPTEKVINQRREINKLLLRQKWSITSIFGADNKIIVADKTTINIQTLLNTADIEDKFFVEARDLIFAPSPRVDFVNENIDVYRNVDGDFYYVYFEGKLVFTCSHIETLLDALIDVDTYIHLFKQYLTNTPKEELDTFKNESMTVLHDKLSSIAWGQYRNNLHDYGVKKVVSVKELLVCQDMVTPVCQVLESQNTSRKDVLEFLEQELAIYMDNEQNIRIAYPFNGGTLPIVYFQSWMSVLEWLCKIGNYTLLFRTMEQAKQKATGTTQNTPQTEDGEAVNKVSSSIPEPVRKEANVTEMFLGNQIPLNADNFSIRINFGDFLKETNRFHYLHHKLNQERAILRDKADLIYFSSPIYLSIVLFDHVKLDDEQKKVGTTKIVRVNFMYETWCSKGESIFNVLKTMEFVMLEMNEYNRNELLAKLTKYLQDTPSIVSGIVSHWNYAYQRLLASQSTKDEKVKQAISHYLNTRCFESKMQVGNVRKITETHSTYLFDTAKFVEYFNQLHGKDFKLKDVRSKKYSVVFCSREPSEVWYRIHVDCDHRNGYTFNNEKELLDALANFVL